MPSLLLHNHLCTKLKCLLAVLHNHLCTTFPCKIYPSRRYFPNPMTLPCKRENEAQTTQANDQLGTGKGDRGILAGCRENPTRRTGRRTALLNQANDTQVTATSHCAADTTARDESSQARKPTRMKSSMPKQQQARSPVMTREEEARSTHRQRTAHDLPRLQATQS